MPWKTWSDHIAFCSACGWRYDPEEIEDGQTCERECAGEVKEYTRVNNE